MQPKGVLASHCGQLDPRLNHDPSTEILLITTPRNFEGFMSTGLKREYLKNIRLRYHRGTKKQRSLILDEFCEVCKITRKHAIRLLNDDVSDVPKKPGPERKYGEDVDRHLRHLWEMMGRICSKKMHAAMPLWLPFYHDANTHMKMLLTEIRACPHLMF